MIAWVLECAKHGDPWGNFAGVFSSPEMAKRYMSMILKESEAIDMWVCDEDGDYYATVFEDGVNAILTATITKRLVNAGMGQE